jgi:hypothetical protein
VEQHRQYRHGLEKIAKTVAPSSTSSAVRPFANPLLWSAFTVSGSCTAVQSIQSYEVDDQLAAAATASSSTNHSHHQHHHHSKQLHDHTAATAAAATATATTAASASKVSYT